MNSNYLPRKYYSKQNFLFLHNISPDSRTNLTIEFTNLITWKLVRSMIVSLRIGGQTLQRFISRHSSTYPSPTQRFPDFRGCVSQLRKRVHHRPKMEICVTAGPLQAWCQWSMKSLGTISPGSSGAIVDFRLTTMANMSIKGRREIRGGVGGYTSSPCTSLKRDNSICM